jgi:hypothetical protein
MAKLTRDGLRARQWKLFEATIGKYSLLFYVCVTVALVFAAVAVGLLLSGKKGAWIAGLLAIAFGYLALQAPKHPWVEESTTEAGPAGVKTTASGRNPLAGDLDPDAEPTKQAEPDGEAVSPDEAEGPEQPSGHSPAQE